MLYIEESYNSDEEDDNPQYVRLVYNAYSVAKFINNEGRESELSGGGDGLAASTSASLAGKLGSYYW